MRVLIVAENANQARLSLRLADALAERGVEARFATTRRVCDLGAARVYEGAGREAFLLDDLMPERAVEQMIALERVQSLKVFVTQLLKLMGVVLEGSDGVVLFNDTPMLSATVSKYARRFGLPVFLVQDGFLGFDPPGGPALELPVRAVERTLSLTGARVGKAHAFFRRAYPRSEFGQTAPDRLFVYGRSMVDRVHATQGVSRSRIVPSGAMQLDGVDLNAVRPVELRSPPRLLVADQCLVKYGVIRRDEWERRLAEFLAVLDGHEVLYKFHPSEDDSARAYVRSVAGENVRLVDEDMRTLLDREADVLVTFFSTSFMDALVCGRPTVFYNMPGMSVYFPRIASPLLHNAPTLDRLRAVLSGIAEGRPVPPTPGARPLGYYIDSRETTPFIASSVASELERGSASHVTLRAAGRFERGHLEQVIDVYASRCDAEDAEPAPGVRPAGQPSGAGSGAGSVAVPGATGPVARVGDLELEVQRLRADLNRARADIGRLREEMRRRDPVLRARDLGVRAARKAVRTGRGAASLPLSAVAPLRDEPDLYVVVRDLDKSFGGDGMIIRDYIDHARARLGLGVRVIDIQGPDFRVARTALAKTRRPVVMNGLRTVESGNFPVLARGCSTLHIYLHETEWVFAKLARSQPAQFRALAEAAGRIRFLCSSEPQEALVREAFGEDVATEVIYNTVDLRPLQAQAAEASARRPGPARVLMTGSIQPRKGASLFSAVADLAQRRGLAWEFSWLGPNVNHNEPFTEKKPYLSPNVRWEGMKTRQEVGETLLQSDVLFLSSVDDPFPRSVLEAVGCGRRVVLYGRLALAEKLAGVAGCRAFEPYRAGAALSAIEEALGEEPDAARLADITHSLVDIKGFSGRLARAVGLDGARPEPAPLPGARAVTQS